MRSKQVISEFRYTIENSYLPFRKIPVTFLQCTSYIIAKYHNNVISAFHFSWSRTEWISRWRPFLYWRKSRNALHIPMWPCISQRWSITGLEPFQFNMFKVSFIFFQAVLQGNSLEIRYYWPRSYVSLASSGLRNVVPAIVF